MQSQSVQIPAPRILPTARGPIEYAETGIGPPILALHGAMGGYDQSWLLPRTIAPPDVRCLAISRPGYLGTPLDSGPSPEAQADLCAALLDGLGVEAAVVMAVSGGGPSALQFALRHASRCRALVLVSTCGGPMDTRIPLAFQVMTLAARWPWFVRWMRRRRARDPEASLRRSIADPAVRDRLTHDVEARTLFDAMTASTYDRMAERLAGTANDIRITRTTAYRLEEIRVPTLVVHGTADRIVPFDPHGTALATRIPAAESFPIPGGEHVAIFTHRNEVRTRVAAFLEARALAFPAPSHLRPA